jgi:hypothetical protein
MVIEEAILIKAGIGTVWKIFTDLSRWDTWNSVARRTTSRSGRMKEGERFAFCLRIFSVPIPIELEVREVTPPETVVWTADKFGIFSRHEFLFQQVVNGVLVTSRETFRGLPLIFGGVTFPESTVRKLTVEMLKDLKKAAEKTENHDDNSTARYGDTSA